MDWLSVTGCYRTRARIFRDDPTEYHLRWFIVPDTTPFLPWPHQFGSTVWGYGKDYQFDGPGEQHWFRRRRDLGLPPVKPPDLLGNPDWFLNGVPRDHGPPDKNLLPASGGCCCPPSDALGTACLVECGKCAQTSRLWQIEVPWLPANNRPHKGPQLVDLAWQALCQFTGSGWTQCPKCACMPRVWFVQFNGPCGIPGPAYIVARDGCTFTNCRPPLPDF